MCSLADVHRHSVANIITKTSATKAILLLLFFTVCILVLLLRVYYRITCGLFLLRNQLKQLHSDKQYRRTAPLIQVSSQGEDIFKVIEM